MRALLRSVIRKLAVVQSSTLHSGFVEHCSQSTFGQDYNNFTFAAKAASDHLVGQGSTVFSKSIIFASSPDIASRSCYWVLNSTGIRLRRGTCTRDLGRDAGFKIGRKFPVRAARWSKAKSKAKQINYDAAKLDRKSGAKLFSIGLKTQTQLLYLCCWCFLHPARYPSQCRKLPYPFKGLLEERMMPWCWPSVVPWPRTLGFGFPSSIALTGCKVIPVWTHLTNMICKPSSHHSLD